MQLNREKIQRMFTGSQANGGGGGGGDTEGLASQLWVDQNYLSKEFFLRLFNIHGEDENDDPVDVQPNDLETTITDIEAMFGFWTEQYLSALGQNSEQGGGGITLNAALASINNSPLGNPTGTSTVLMFNGTTWVYASMGSTDMNTVWNALAAATNQQINISHLTTALSSYATTSQLSDYATVTDLEQLASYFNTLSGYFTNGAANEAVKLETARTIWGQQFDGTANITGDITQATCLEFSGISGTATNGGFIDFHYAGGGADYTSRIIEDVSGVLKINNTIWAQLSGNVSIGTSTISQTYKLDVAGYTKTTRLYLADGVYLEYDSTNSGVHLVGAGFYSDSYVSALGVNSGGGGGGTDYIPLTGSSSITGTLAPSVATADLGSSTNKWRNIYGTSLSISNTLTTYALTVNSSATVVGSITATNGNLVASTGYVSSAGGYKVTGKDDTSVLLAGGGTKPLSEIGSAYTLPAASVNVLGGIMVHGLPGAAMTVQALGHDSTRNYGVQLDSNNKAFVNVPWENDDTKNTAGNYDTYSSSGTSPKLYITGALSYGNSSSSYDTTDVNRVCYIENNCLYSNGSKVLTTAETGFLPLSGGTMTGVLNTPSGFSVQRETGNTNEYLKISVVDVCSVIEAYDSDTYSSILFKTNGTDRLRIDGYYKRTEIYGKLLISPPHESGHQEGITLHDRGSGASEGLRIRWTSTDYTTGCYLEGRPDTNELVFNGYAVYHTGNLTNVSQLNNNAGYVTSSSLGSMAYETASDYVLYSDLTDYATKTWVGQQGYLTTTPASLAVTTSLTVGGNAVWSVGDFTLKSYTSLQDLGWVSDTADAKKVVTSNALAYWNGKYDSGTNHSNLAYCNQGAFGSMATKNASDYVQDTSGYAYINNRLVVSGGSTIAAPSETLYVNGTGRFNDVLECADYFCVRRFSGDSNQYLKIDVEDVRTYFYGYDSDGGMNFTFQSNGTTLLELVGFGDKCIDAYGKVRIIPPQVSGNQDGLVLHDSGSGGSEAVRIRWTSASYTTGCYLVGQPDTNRLIFNGYAVYHTGNLTNVSQLTNDAGYLTSGDVVTVVGAQSITGAKTFTATLTSSAGGSFTGGLRFYSLCVECASDGTPSSSRYGEINRYNNTLHLQYDSGTGGVTMCQQGFTFTNTGSTRSITINASLQLTCGSGTPYTDKNWVYNSDMRKKDVIRLIDMDAQRIADAPIFDFTWKSDTLKELTLGTSAQYWQKVFPNAVRTTPDGYLGMDYSSIALASAVLTARKVVDHEARIRLLEVENAALRNEINQLKKVA